MSILDTIEGGNEPAQGLKTRSELTARELLREVGSVLRMSEADAAKLGELPTDPSEDQTMIINMGPQHPSTHGVLRLMLELQGETVLRCKPIIGYLHTGMEKTGEALTYMQGGTNVTRMDYVSPLNNELVFSMAVEKLLGIEDDIPDRAVWMRMLLSELNRMSSHLLFLATNGMDLGAVSMMIYGWREREEVLRFFQKVTGLRMNHNFIRPGGVAADLPAGWRDDVLGLLEAIEPRLDEYDTLMTGQPIWRERLQGVGVITAQEAIALGATGPILRGAGVPWDLRRDQPLPALPRARLRRHRRLVRRCLRPVRDPAERGAREHEARPPDPGPHAVGRLPHPEQEGHATAARSHRREHGSAHPPLQDLHRGLQGARGRGVRGDREPAWRDRLLHRQRRLTHAVPHARACPVVREHPVLAAHDARRPGGRRGGRHLQRRPRPRRGGPMNQVNQWHD